MLYQHISFDKHFLRKFLPGVPLSLTARGERTWAEKIRFYIQKQTFHNNFHLQKCLRGLFSFLWIVKTNSETLKFRAKWNPCPLNTLITSEHTKCWFSSSYLEDLGIPKGRKSGNHKKCGCILIAGFFLLGIAFICQAACKHDWIWLLPQRSPHSMHDNTLCLSLQSLVKCVANLS